MEAKETIRRSIDTDELESAQGTEPQALQLLITRSQDLETCPFWVSLYKPGPVAPQQLFQIPSIEGIFKVLLNDGLQENQALMLAENTEGERARQLYLIPESLCHEQPERARDLILSTLASLGPERLGLYLPSFLEGARVSTHVIEEISLGLSFLRTKELHFYTGNIGINPLLNAALRIKHRLDGRREVLVYH